MLQPSYALLCGIQGALVMTPSRRRPVISQRALGLAVPAAAMLVGVGAIQLLSNGAQWLAWLAAIATPLLAAAAGWSLNWPGPLGMVAAIAAVPLYVIAWQARGDAGELARALLVAGACLTLAAWLAAVADADSLAVGLVILVAIDAYLVWGAHQVAPAASALHQAGLPSVGIAGLPSRPLPPLQDVTLGASMMGWLDLFAPAVLGMLVFRRPHPRAPVAATVTISALAWGLLLLVTTPIPATVPVIAGLAVLYRDRWRLGAAPPL